ncbi:MAG: superoxide dismutase, partial [Victivallaceae bacterium]
METLQYTLPELPYGFAELEPVISEEILRLHYLKHHAGYVNNLNTALKQLERNYSGGDLNQIIALQKTIRFNGGGHINHSLFWEMLTPESKGGGELPKGPLLKALEEKWGSFENFLTKFIEFAVPHQGSGWAWLGYDPVNKTLCMRSTDNQDPLEPTTGVYPVFGIDLW